MLINEHTIDLSHASKLFPHNPHLSTVFRWCRKGFNGIRLEYLRAGRHMFTTTEACERFARALADADQRDRADTHPAPHTKPARRERDIQAAEARLVKAGL